MANRAAVTLVAILAILALARAVAGFSPNMWAWGFNEQRFLPSGVVWGLWALSLAVLVAPLAGRLASVFDRFAGPSHGWSGKWGMLAAASLTGSLVLLLSDETWFTGDFILRLGVLRGEEPAQKIFPQALPLDLFVHFTLPRLVSSLLSIDVALADRLLAALKAAVLGGVAVELARVLGLRGAAAVGVATMVAAGGYLGMFTGNGQAFSDITLAVVVVGTYGLRACLTGKGFGPVAIAVALGLLLHREALALLPALAAAWVLLGPANASPDRPRRLRALAWMAFPLLALAVVAPKILRLVTGFDRAHVVPGGSGLSSLAAAFAPGHLWDLLNLVGWLTPPALGGPVLVVALASFLKGRRETLFLLALAGPWLLSLLFIHPYDQGMVRDWGTFAAAGAAFSVATAWLIAQALRLNPERAWLGLAVAVGASVPTVGQLVVSHDPRAGVARVEAYVNESPRRSDAHRTLALDYLGVRYGALGDAEAAARSYERATEITPSPRMMYNWALAEGDRGQYARSKEILLRLLAEGLVTPEALYTLGAVSFMAGDTALARRAAERTLALAPGATSARELLRRIDDGAR